MDIIEEKHIELRLKRLEFLDAIIWSYTVNESDASDIMDPKTDTEVPLWIKRIARETREKWKEWMMAIRDKE